MANSIETRLSNFITDIANDKEDAVESKFEIIYDFSDTYNIPKEEVERVWKKALKEAF